MKTTKIDNYRVVLYMTYAQWRASGKAHADYRRVGGDIRRKIMARLDECSGPEGFPVAFEFDSEEVCSHCGQRWEEDTDPKGLPMCCAKAQAEWQAEQRPAPTEGPTDV